MSIRHVEGALSAIAVDAPPPRPPPPQQMSLLLFGDVHPHPGPMCFIVSSVTSLRAHWSEVLEWEADAILLAETRLTLQGQWVMPGLAREAGWQAFWGAPPAIQVGGGGVGMPPQGGVGLLARQGVPVRAVDLPRMRGEDPLHTELSEPYRWMHVLVGTGSDNTAVHVQPVYGHSGRSEESTAFFGRVVEYVAQQGNTP